MRVTSWPCTRTPPVMAAWGGSRRMSARMDTLLPEPLSPSRHSTSPGMTRRLTPRTASTASRPVPKRTRSSSSSATGIMPRKCPEPGWSMWQAAWCPSQLAGVGTTAAHTASAWGQRVRKRQPEGGLAGEGGSPVIGASVARRSGSMVRREASSARV